METEEKFVVATVILILIGIFGGMFWVKKHQCTSSYENYQPQWGIISGCRIVVDGKLTPVDIVREIK